jgi:hypothetical protein
MKTIIRLVVLAVGFLAGIYVGVHYPKQAANIDQVRAEEQAKIQPKIEEAAAKAKLEVLNRVFGGSSDASAGPKVPGAGFVSGGGGGSDVIMPADKKAELMKEMDQAKQQLQDAQNKMAAK